MRRSLLFSILIIISSCTDAQDEVAELPASTAEEEIIENAAELPSSTAEEELPASTIIENITEDDDSATDAPTDSPTEAPTEAPTHPPPPDRETNAGTEPEGEGLSENYSDPSVEDTSNLQTDSPTNPPTDAPTNPPTDSPTNPPTETITNAPTEAPTIPQTKSSTNPPTETPNNPSTEVPTNPPTEAPTQAPTITTTETLTNPPTEAPTDPQTEAPTIAPTESPTQAPINLQTAAPTHSQTEDLSKNRTEITTNHDIVTSRPTHITPKAAPWPLGCTSGLPQTAAVWLKAPGKPIVITSPNYPLSFNSSHFDCTWEVYSEFGSNVKMTVIEANVNSGCEENSLTAFDETSINGDSLLKYPGLSSKCGDSNFPSAIQPVVSNGALTIKFVSDNNDGSVKFKLILEATVPECPSSQPDTTRAETCPNGPCCEGVDCCVVKLGTSLSDITSPNYPNDSGNNKNCQYKLVAPEGSRVSINFLDMDMQRDHLHTCLYDRVHLEEPEASASGVIGTKGVKVCGQHLPNYPGPSVFVSAGNTMVVKYYTDATNTKRGRGFKAAVSAINPLCSTMSYSHKYGNKQCEASCTPTGFPTPAPQPSTITPGTGSTPYIPPSQPTTKAPETTEKPTTPKPCFKTDAPLTITILNNQTNLPITDAMVNISSVISSIDSASRIFHKTKITGVDGKVRELVAENGNYKVSVTAQGFVAQTMDVIVQCDFDNCEECNPSAVLKLTKNPGPEPPIDDTCDDVHMSITVINPLTSEKISAAFVDVSVKPEGGEIQNVALVATDLQGKVSIPMSINGEYTMEISKAGFDTLSLTSTVACDTNDCPACNVDLIANLTRKPPCNGPMGNVTMRIHVRDQLEENVPEADVKVEILGDVNKVIKEDKSNENGKVNVKIPDNGNYRVTIEKEGFKVKEQETTVECDPDNCEACSPVVVVYIEELVTPSPRPTTPTTDPTATTATTDPNATTDPTATTTTAPTTTPTFGEDQYIPPRCSDGETTFKVKVFDDLTHETVNNAKITVTYVFVDTSYPLATEESPDINGELSKPITIMGDYTITVISDGYKPATKVVHVACTEDTCADCNTEVDVPLLQEFCEEASIKLVVKDSTAGSPLKDALVTVVVIGDNHNETLADEKPTDENGVLSVEITGMATYLVKISKDGYTGYEGDNQVICDPDDCAACNPVLDIDLTQEFGCTESVKVDITVIDQKSEQPIEGAKVNLTLTNSIAGPSSHDVGGILVTDSNGKVAPPVNIDGRYRISIASEHHLAHSQEIDINSTITCQNPEVAVSLAPTIEPYCPNKNMEVTVHDLHTQHAVPNAKIDIIFHELYQGSYIVGDSNTGLTTDANGKVTIPVTANGNFSISVTEAPEGYDLTEGTLNVQCSIHECDACEPKLILDLDQKRCPSTVMPITITDGLLHHPIVGARVTLELIDSLSGPSLIPVGEAKVTDVNGTVVFPANMNGKYVARVEKAGYVTNEMNTTVACDVLDCEGCAPVLNIPIRTDFCVDKTMTIVILDAVENNPVTGATVTMSMAGYLQPVGARTETVDEFGVVTFPIEGNGFYSMTVEMEGFIPMTKTMQVNTTLEQCDILAPVEIFPLSPELPCPHGARVSLSWNDQPQDLDIFSFRVVETDTSNRCLTYYCDQKELCGCTTFDTDNTNGGHNGTETITYCCEDTNSHMIYIDDQSGRGASLLSSGAELTITGKDRTQRVKMNPATAGDNHRYWLAGCLTIDENGFEFDEVNGFSSGSPNVETPLLCHNRIALRRLAEIPHNLPTNVSVLVTVRDAVSNVLLEGASIELSTRSESHARTADYNGRATIPIDHNGKYKVDVEMEGYAAATSDITVACESVDQCVPTILISMSPEMGPGTIRILLNWEDQPDDLDLYSVQVNKVDSLDSCITYHGNMDGCSAAALDQNNQNGGTNGAETITYHDVSANSKYTHMVFVDDFSGSGATLAESKARVTVTDGTHSTTVEMPEFDDNTPGGARYWFAGCMQIVGETYKFMPQSRFSRNKPSDVDKLFCDKLFQQGGANVMELDTIEEPFCDNIKMKVKVRNGVTNEPIPGATADVHHIHNTSDSMVIEGATTLDDGTVDVAINQNGEYLINIKADGYVRDQAFLKVECDIQRCGSCEPSTLLSLSPALTPGNLRIIMNWDSKPSDLDLYTYQIDTQDRSVTCTTFWNNKDGCSGINLDKDNARGGDNGAETMTFNDVTHNSQYIYMIYVKDYSNNPEEFKASNVHLTLTDGVDITKINIDATNYDRERYWFAGCMKIVGQSFQFVPSNAFTSSSPKEEVAEHCLNLFDLNVDPTACFEEKVDYPGNDMNDGSSNKQPDASACRESCLRRDSCVGFAWNKRTTDCWLKPTMVQEKRQNDEVTSGFAVCDNPTAPPPPPPPQSQQESWWSRTFG